MGGLGGTKRSYLQRTNESKEHVEPYIEACPANWPLDLLLNHEVTDLVGGGPKCSQCAACWSSESLADQQGHWHPALRGRASQNLALALEERKGLAMAAELLFSFSAKRADSRRKWVAWLRIRVVT